eukprot:6469833-Amphidinium_carterae.3
MAVLPWRSSELRERPEAWPRVRLLTPEVEQDRRLDLIREWLSAISLPAAWSVTGRRVKSNANSITLTSSARSASR